MSKGIRLGSGVFTAAMLLCCAFSGCSKQEGIPEGAVSVLEAADYEEKITADGTVECADPHYVYSSLTLPVKEILVKEGDTVAAGDLLCVLDTGTIEDQIALQQASIDLAQRNASANVVAASHQYGIYEEGLANGTDANLVAAMSNLEIAREKYETAQKQYDDYKESLNLGMDPTLVAADQAVDRASTAGR